MYSVRKIIFITRNHKIYDTPDDTRKIHGAEIPSLGGIGIFIGYIVVAAFFWPRSHYFMPYILSSSVILFFTGIYDDLMNMRPSKKLMAQLIASLITVCAADIRINSLYGLFGIWDIAYWPGIMLTTVGCTFFINAFNFIDGIDGLACIIASLNLALLGCLFLCTRHYSASGIAFSLMGATLGLLVYNIAPAKIYMGDTGSMLLGFTIFVFSVLFIRTFAGDNGSQVTTLIHSNIASLLLIFSMLFLPVFDAIRVFILRLSKGVSPLRADRSHLHYYLLDAGFNHATSVWIILAVDVLIIATAYLLQDANPAVVLCGITLIAAIAQFIIYRLRVKNMPHLPRLSN
jgi:UDP-GlcNAc:undecaprenyl-phosphate GlcNAc-1-phosphate transferase